MCQTDLSTKMKEAYGVKEEDFQATKCHDNWVTYSVTQSQGH